MIEWMNVRKHYKCFIVAEKEKPICKCYTKIKAHRHTKSILFILGFALLFCILMKKKNLFSI